MKYVIFESYNFYKTELKNNKTNRYFGSATKKCSNNTKTNQIQVFKNLQRPF